MSFSIGDSSSDDDDHQHQHHQVVEPSADQSIASLQTKEDDVDFRFESLKHLLVALEKSLRKNQMTLVAI